MTTAPTDAEHPLVLSLFPGLDILGTGFAQAGFCVVRGPDIIWNQDIRTFCPPPNKFAGIVAGPPCQDFSRARRAPPTGYGLAMLAELARCVTAASPDWWLCENVPQVPTLTIPPYTTQRFTIAASQFGQQHIRNRCIQFGHLDGHTLRIPRPTERRPPTPLPTPTSHDTRRNWPELLALMGLPTTWHIPGLSRTDVTRLIANAVTVPVAAALARAVRDRHTPSLERFCICGCGRGLRGPSRQQSATAACRKRMERSRLAVTQP